MVKSLNEMLDELGHGVVTGLASPVDIRNIKKYASQVTNSLQPGLPSLLNNIEAELNKFGYSLGSLDDFQDEEKTGTEDFVVIAYPDGDEARNIFLTLSWETVSPEIYKHSAEKLTLSVTLTVNEIDPEDFDDLVSGTAEISTDETLDESKEDPCWDSHKQVGMKDKNGKKVPNCVPKESVEEETKSYNVSFTVKDSGNTRKVRVQATNSKEALQKFKTSQAGILSGIKDIKVLAESVEDLEEALMFKKVGKTFQVKDNDMNFYFTVESAGSIFFSIQTKDTNDRAMQFRVPKNKASQFMTSLMDHFIDHQK